MLKNSPNLVVAAVVLQGDKLLVARRREGSLAGYWEFPGGKVEAGETPQQALRREIQEELSTDAEVGAYIGESIHLSERGKIRLEFYRCELTGDPIAGEAHDAVLWVKLTDALSYRLAPADIPIVRKLLEDQDET